MEAASVRAGVAGCRESVRAGHGCPGEQAWSLPRIPKKKCWGRKRPLRAAGSVVSAVLELCKMGAG